MTALQPPILNLNRLMISSGCPSDFRMSMMLHAFCCYFVKRRPGNMLPIQTMRRRDAAAAAAVATAKRNLLLLTYVVRSTDASDWSACHGLRAKGPIGGETVWCDVPPQPLIGQLIMQGKLPVSMKWYIAIHLKDWVHQQNIIQHQRHTSDGVHVIL